MQRAVIAMTTWQNEFETIREEGVNVHLAQLLRGRGISARAERRSREGIPDVRADLRSGDPVILECKWEESVSLLQSQLDERLAAVFGFRHSRTGCRVTSISPLRSQTPAGISAER